MVSFTPQTFWHSSAHLLGQALELEYGVDLTIGPALEEGFYYDCFMGDKVWGGVLLRLLHGRQGEVVLLVHALIVSYIIPTY